MNGLSKGDFPEEIPGAGPWVSLFFLTRYVWYTEYGVRTTGEGIIRGGSTRYLEWVEGTIVL